MDKNEYNNQRKESGYLTGQNKPKSKVLDIEEFHKKKKQELERKILKKFINHDKNLGWK